MTETGSLAAASCLRHDARLSCRYWLGQAASCVAAFDNMPVEDAMTNSFDHTDVLLLSLTGKALESQLVRKAREHGVPCAQLLDVWGPYAHRLAGEIADRVAVIDEIAREEAIHDGMDGAIIVVTGQAAWEHAPDLPPAPPSTIAFLSQPIARLYGDRLGYTERDALAALETAVASRPDVATEIIVVPHPEGDLLSSDLRAQYLDVALTNSGTVVSPFSSAMVNAFLAGRRVVSLQPQAIGGDRCALSRRGFIPKALDVSSLRRALAVEPISARSLQATLAGSGKRLADLLVEMVA